MDQPRPLRERLALTRRRVRRTVLSRRRPLAAVAAALAAVIGIQAAAPPPPPTRTVLTAARDLPAGAVLGPEDVVPAPFAEGSVPGGAVDRPAAVLGRMTTGPMRTGEPITDVRIFGESLLEGYPGRVAAPVRIGDRGVVELLRVGDRVDVIAADPQGQTDPVVVATDAPVIALPPAPEAALASGGLVVVAVADTTARALAGAAVASYLSVTVTR
jgi:Flp pilus assembly protein CpaB